MNECLFATQLTVLQTINGCYNNNYCGEETPKNPGAYKLLFDVPQKFRQ